MVGIQRDVQCALGLQWKVTFLGQDQEQPRGREFIASLYPQGTGEGRTCHVETVKPMSF
jgi:hypothetical protein